MYQLYISPRDPSFFPAHLTFTVKVILQSPDNITGEHTLTKTHNKNPSSHTIIPVNKYNPCKQVQNPASQTVPHLPSFSFCFYPRSRGCSPKRGSPYVSSERLSKNTQPQVRPPKKVYAPSKSGRCTTTGRLYTLNP